MPARIFAVVLATSTLPVRDQLPDPVVWAAWRNLSLQVCKSPVLSQQLGQMISPIDDELYNQAFAEAVSDVLATGTEEWCAALQERALSTSGIGIRGSID